MEVSIKYHDRVPVVGVSGDIDAMTSPKLEEVLFKLVDEGRTKIILDLGGVGYISSAGLRVLLGTTNRFAGEGQLVLSRLKQNVAEVIEMTGFSSILEICADPADALEAIPE